MQEFSHLNQAGRGRMVDVGDKEVTQRLALARGWVSMSGQTLERIREGTVGKGDVLGVAQLAGIMAAKRTHELIPLCHPLRLAAVDLDFNLDDERGRVIIEARVRAQDRTGVEMEALTAVSVAGLALYDMCKALDREMVIGDVRLVEKSGGRSGHYRREEAEDNG